MLLKYIYSDEDQKLIDFAENQVKIATEEAIKREGENYLNDPHLMLAQKYHVDLISRLFPVGVEVERCI